MTSCTPDISSSVPGSTSPLFPVMPIAVRSAPGMEWARYPSASIFWQTARTCASVACACITTNMNPPRKVQVYRRRRWTANRIEFGSWLSFKFVLKGCGFSRAVNFPKIIRGFSRWGDVFFRLTDTKTCGPAPGLDCSLYFLHAPFHCPRAGHPQAACPQAPASLDPAQHWHSYLDCWRRPECGRTRLPAGLQYLPDFFLQPAPVGAL